MTTTIHIFDGYYIFVNGEEISYLTAGMLYQKHPAGPQKAERFERTADGKGYWDESTQRQVPALAIYQTGSVPLTSQDVRRAETLTAESQTLICATATDFIRVLTFGQNEYGQWMNYDNRTYAIDNMEIDPEKGMVRYGRREQWLRCAFDYSTGELVYRRQTRRLFGRSKQQS